MARQRPAAVAVALVAVLTACGGDPEPASAPPTSSAPSVTPMLPGAAEPTPAGDAGAPSRDPADVLADVEVTGITGDTPFEQEAIAVLRSYFGEFAVAQATNDASRPELAAVLDAPLLANLAASVAQRQTDGEYIVGTVQVVLVEANELSSGTDVLVELCLDGRDRQGYAIADDAFLGTGTEVQDIQALVTRSADGTRLTQLVAGQPGLCERAGL